MHTEVGSASFAPRVAAARETPGGAVFIDFQSEAAPREFAADLCVIGAGAAGITELDPFSWTLDDA